MAYFVARELHMRPYEILTKWTCEELLVSYGEYANIHSAEAYDSRMAMFDKSKPKKPTPDEKYAVIFLTQEELEQSNKEAKENEGKPKLSDIAKNFF